MPAHLARNAGCQGRIVLDKNVLARLTVRMIRKKVVPDVRISLEPAACRHFVHRTATLTVIIPRAYASSFYPNTLFQQLDCMLRVQFKIF